MGLSSHEIVGFSESHVGNCTLTKRNVGNYLITIGYYLVGSSITKHAERKELAKIAKSREFL